MNDLLLKYCKLRNENKNGSYYFFCNLLISLENNIAKVSTGYNDVPLFSYNNYTDLELFLKSNPQRNCYSPEDSGFKLNRIFVTK